MPSTKTAKIVYGKTKNEGPSTKTAKIVDGKPTEYGKDYNKGQGTDDGRDQNSDF